MTNQPTVPSSGSKEKRRGYESIPIANARHAIIPGWIRDLLNQQKRRFNLRAPRKETSFAQPRPDVTHISLHDTWGKRFRRLIKFGSWRR